MKTSIAILAALLFAPCACSRHEKAPPLAVALAAPIEPAPSAAPPSPAPAQAVAEPEPQPTPAEVAVFHAPVPK
jgi:hypothetical protein